MTAIQKFCASDGGLAQLNRGDVAVSGQPRAVNSSWMKVEILRAGGDSLSDSTTRTLTILQGRGASPEFRDLRGEQSELEKVAAADIVIVYGNDTEQLRRTIEQMRAARLTFPIVALREQRDQASNADLLRAGYDDIYDSSVELDELVARVRSLHERSQIYERRNSQGLSLRRGTKGESTRDVFSGRERTILTVLQENQGRIVTYEEILTRIGKAATARAVHTLQVTMSGLRQKLSDEWKILGINRTGYILVMSDGAHVDMPEQVFG